MIYPLFDLFIFRTDFNLLLFVTSIDYSEVTIKLGQVAKMDIRKRCFGLFSFTWTKYRVPI